MIQHTETFHRLETRMRRGNEGEWLTWHSAEAVIYREAYIAAYHGNLVKALELADKAHLRQFGSLHNVDFRCVTTTRTVTLQAGLASPDRTAR